MDALLWVLPSYMSEQYFSNVKPSESDVWFSFQNDEILNVVIQYAGIENLRDLYLKSPLIQSKLNELWVIDLLAKNMVFQRRWNILDVGN